MDETGIELLLGVLGIVIAIAIGMAWWWHKQRRRVEVAKDWPITEARIESGKLEGTTQSRAVLPTFAFSYQVAGEYHSGRFGLIPCDIDPGTLIDRMVGRKLPLRYDPRRPDVWFIADERIEGCKVEQKIGPHAIALYPRD